MKRSSITLGILILTLGAATIRVSADEAKTKSKGKTPAPATYGSSPLPGPTPPCPEVCSKAVRALGECALRGSGGVGALAEVSEQARVAQLDCDAACRNWSADEVTRIHACFPSDGCADYAACLSASPERAPVKTKSRTSDGAEMAWVPAGPFTRGVPAVAQRLGDLPASKIDVPGFWIDRTEVTLDRYFRCFEAHACTSADRESTRHGNLDQAKGEEVPRNGCNWGVPGRGDHPVNCVSYAQAKAYCAWAGARLPSENEWEKAARGDDARRYPWGPWPRSCSLLHYRSCESRSTTAVATHAQGDSPFGVHDLAGNVWEWVGGTWKAANGAEPADDDAPMTEASAYGVLRGGGFGYDAPFSFEDHDAATRFRFYKSNRFEGVGFRCATGG